MNGDGIGQVFGQTLFARWAERIAGLLAGDSAGARGSAGQGAGGAACLAAPAAFAGMIASAARDHGVPEDLLKAVIQAESNFNPRAVSAAGAKGLMQLMDGTARQLGVRDVFDPAQNTDGGASFLAQLLQRYGSVSLALAAYNAGPGAVDRYGGIPPYAETQAYVQRIMSAYTRDWEA